MKAKYLFLAMAATALTLTACSDDDDAFDSGLTSSAFHSTPITGGAILYYQLPADPNVDGLYVHYQDAYGQNIIRSGSSANDSLILTGFNEARQDVPAQVYINRRNGEQSQPINITFSTADSGPVAFLRDAKVLNNWEGFTVEYSAPAYAEGLIHVFYLGTDPQTGQPDTVLINSFTIDEASYDSQVSFKIKQKEVTHPTVIIRAEDFRGHVVGERVFEGIECLQSAKLDPSKFDFHSNVTVENEYNYIGQEFLFDGDTKGTRLYTEYDAQYTCYSYIAGPFAAGEDPEPFYIDLRQNRLTAAVRLYNQLANSMSRYAYWLGDSDGYSSWLPCWVELYGAVDDGSNQPLDERDMENLNWQRISSFRQDKSLANSSRWCPMTYPNVGWNGCIENIDDMMAAPEEYMELVVSASGQGNTGYRYLKMVVRETFNVELDYTSDWYNNTSGYVTFTELEVYTKKED